MVAEPTLRRERQANERKRVGCMFAGLWLRAMKKLCVHFRGEFIAFQRPPGDLSLKVRHALRGCLATSRVQSKSSYVSPHLDADSVSFKTLKRSPLLCAWLRGIEGVCNLLF